MSCEVVCIWCPMRSNIDRCLEWVETYKVVHFQYLLSLPLPPSLLPTSSFLSGDKRCGCCLVCSADLPRPSSPPPPLPPAGILEACIWSARTESPVSLSVCTSDAHVTGSPFPSSHSCKILGIILSDFPRHSSSMALTRLPARSLRRKIPNVK